MVLRKVLPVLAIFCGVSLLSGCGRSEAEYRKLVDENARLKAQIEKLQRSDGAESSTPSAAPELKLSLSELWEKRFDDNETRARYLLANKTIRTSGSIESVGDDSVVITGHSKRFGVIRMGIKLIPGYAIRVRNGLALMEKGATVAVHGKFIYERMAIDDAVFVNLETGKTLYSDNLTAQSGAGTPSIAAPPAEGGQQK